MPTLPEILKKTIVARSRLFAIEEVALRFSNGVERIYERLRAPGRGAVLVVPLLDDDTVVMIREYGVGTERYELGLPKGAMDEGETLEEAATRELMEEAGYGARTLTPLRGFTLSPSYMGHQLMVVLAEDLYPERREGDEPEPLEVLTLKLSELEQWVWREELSEARVVAALYLVRDLMRQRRERADASLNGGD